MLVISVIAAAGFHDEGAAPAARLCIVKKRGIFDVYVNDGDRMQRLRTKWESEGVMITKFRRQVCRALEPKLIPVLDVRLFVLAHWERRDSLFRILRLPLGKNPSLVTCCILVTVEEAACSPLSL